MIVSVLLLVVGLAGFALGGMMFGDIGVAAMIGGAGALLSGIGLFRLSRRVTALERERGAS